MSYDRTSSLLPLLNQANVPLDQQGTVLNDAFARQLAFSLPVPANEVDPAAFFQSNYGDYVCDQACRINESIVISVDEAIARVYAVWLIRYQIVHCPTSPAAQAAVEAGLEVSNDFQRDRGLMGTLGTAMSIVQFQPPGAVPAGLAGSVVAPVEA